MSIGIAHCVRGRCGGYRHADLETGRDERLPGDREGRTLLKRSLTEANGPFVLLTTPQRPFVLKEIESIARAAEYVL